MGIPRDTTGRNAIRPPSGRSDRRGVCRHPVVIDDASLGWWQDSSFLSTPCRIIDISQYGFMIKTRRLPGPKEGQSVWLLPRGLSPSDWAEGIIVSIRKPLLRECQVRIKLLAPFPYESFKTLVHGPDHVRKIDRLEAPEHEQDHFWR
jgi:hypothetical protein